MFLPHPRVKLRVVESLRDREVACSTSDRQVLNFESRVWRTVSSHSSHHPQEVLLAQFSLYVHKGGLKPDSFHFYHALTTVTLSTIWASEMSNSQITASAKFSGPSHHMHTMSWPHHPRANAVPLVAS